MRPEKLQKLRKLRNAPVTLEMAGTFLGLIFGGIALFASAAARWGGNRPDVTASDFAGYLAAILLGIAGISILFRLIQLDSRQSRARMLAWLAVGFFLFAVDVVVFVFVEMYVTQSILHDVLLGLSLIAGLGTAGLFAMARAMIDSDTGTSSK